jgi:uncharacterized membrane protein YdjX (TVP38/TMEM64 family)
MNFIAELLQNFQTFIAANPWFAPLAAFLLPFLEAIFPFLSLTILISFNLSVMSSIYGIGSGTLYTILLSVLGSFTGMFLIFLFIRATLAKYFIRQVEKNEFGRKFITIVDKKNMGMALMLLSNPFLPSSIMNYGLSLTKIKTSKYLLLTGVSRIIIILFVVFLGSVFNIQSHPWNVVWLMVVYFAVFVGTALIKYIKAKKLPPKT